MISVLSFLLSTFAFGQGSRPPVTTLSGLTDVFIASPANGQMLTWNAGTSKWNNGAVPVPTLATLGDVAVVSAASNQVLKWDSGSSKWVNYGPLAFTDITGNITPAQANGGLGAASDTYWRGDGTWGKPPTGAIPFTTNLLQGDGNGNTVASGFTDSLGSHSTYGSSYNGLSDFVLLNGAGLAASAAGFGLVTNTGGTAKLLKMGSATTAGFYTPLQNPNDTLLIADSAGFGNLVITCDNNIIIGKQATATERVRINNGIMAGLTTDKGAGTVNVSSGYYVNGNKIDTTVATVATLPASHWTGQLATVSDGAASLAWGATVTGGGSTKYLVWWNGTNWTVTGK